MSGVCLTIWVCIFHCYNDGGELNLGAKFLSVSGLPGSQPGGTMSEQNHSGSKSHLLNTWPRI